MFMYVAIVVINKRSRKFYHKIDKCRCCDENVFFSKLNAAIVKPCIAPPVPSNPAEKPESEPPSYCIPVFCIKNDITFY